MSDFKFEALAYTNKELVDFSLKIFEHENLCNKLKINSKVLENLITSIAKHYNVVPYHNFTHGFTVFHLLYHCFKFSGFKNYANDIQIFSGLIAALTHDINHSF